MTALANFRLNDIIVDVEPADVPPEFWTDGRNIQFRDNKAERVGGYAPALLPPASAPRHLVPMFFNNIPYWLFAADNNSIYVTDGTSIFDITPTPAPAPSSINPWTSDVLNGIAVMTCGVGDPWYWNNSTASPMQSLPGWQAGHTCRVIRAYKNYLLAMAYFDGVSFLEDRIAWSDAAPPGAVPSTWVPSATNDAGDFTLSDQPGEILDGQPLRDQFIVYAKNAVYALNFIGGNSIFSQRKLFANEGALSRNCVAEVRGRHYVLSLGDIIVHDGNQVTSLIDRRWRSFLAARIDPETFERAFVATNLRHNELWFFLPSAGSQYPNSALIYNYEEDRLGWRELDEVRHAAAALMPTTAITSIDELTGEIDDLYGSIDSLSGGQTSRNEFLLAVDLPDGFLQVDAANDLNGVPINASLRRESLDMGAPRQQKTVTAIWPRITNGTVSVRVGTQQEPHEPITWGNSVPVVGDRVPVFASGRYISVEFASSGGQQWRSSGFDIEYRLGGRY